MKPRVLLLAALSLAARPVWADETCRYSGTTDYSGRAFVETKASRANGETTINVAARVDARSLGIIHWQYLYQEIGVWRDGELQTIGVNHRYSVLESIRRQQWDVFRRGPDGMAAWRVQAKTLEDFEKTHPGFIRQWDPASFGQPWLRDYATARPERRADLDLPRASMPSGFGTPLQMAFYWVRWAGPRRRTVALFLPGFKRDARADATIVPAGDEANGTVHLHASVRHQQLSETKFSTGDSWISPDHRLLRVVFDARADHANAHGELHLDGCEGEPLTP